MIADQQIGAVKPILDDQIQPSSLDLRLGARIWQLQCCFYPETRASRKGRLATAEWRVQRDRPLVLRRGGVYLAEVEEVLELPEDVWGRGNPKSSTGRLDVFVRLLTEFGEAFDTVPAGYQGRLHTEITRSPSMSPFGAVTVSGRSAWARAPSCRTTHSWPTRKPALLWCRGLTVAPHRSRTASTQHSTVGRSRRPRWSGRLPGPSPPTPIDLARRNLTIDRYWTALPPAPKWGTCWSPSNSTSSPPASGCASPDVCAELVAFDATKGELRTHYAGFIDAGFGWSPTDEGPGARLVLEIRTHDVPFLLEHGQPLFRLQFMANETRPDMLYGAAGTGSHYQMQELRLAKQFAPTELSHFPTGIEAGRGAACWRFRCPRDRPRIRPAPR